jgi:hypothetical protein
MEKYCITLEQAKRLVELGFSKSCEYSYRPHWAHGTLEILKNAEYGNGLYPAYHVGELGEIISPWAFDIIVRLNPDLEDIGLGWALSYPDQVDFRGICKDYPTEAQARGALLIYLLENQLI